MLSQEMLKAKMEESAQLFNQIKSLLEDHEFGIIMVVMTHVMVSVIASYSEDEEQASDTLAKFVDVVVEQLTGEDSIIGSVRLPEVRSQAEGHELTLAPVQLEAITRADGRRGFAYYMEMGLGKTLTVLTEFKTLRMCNAVERLVVVCPNSFKGGWADEIEKHQTGLKAHIYEAKRPLTLATMYTYDVLIINYEAVRTKRGLEAVLNFVEDRSAYLALDESIKLKNRLSQQTKAIIGSMYKQEMRGGITMFFDYIRLLSGKPMSQGPHDLWAQMMAINEMGMTYYGFQNRYCHLGGWMNKEITGSQNEAELQDKLAKVSFQAKKKDWLTGLPPKVYSIRRHQLGAALQKHYDEMEEEFLTYLQGETVTVAVAIAKYEKLSQIQCGFLINEQGEARQLCTPEENPRINLLKDILDEEVSGKVVIVYRHRAVGEYLELCLTNFDDENDNVAWIRGGMSPGEIEVEKARFQDNANIILLQAEAGKYGHTLVGTPDDPCGTMIFFENSYSLDTRAQLEDRIHRIGAVAESCLYLDLSGSDIDERIVRALQRKERMFEAVFGKDLEMAA